MTEPSAPAALPQWARERLCPSEADRILVVVSDIEMGAGGVADDFPQTDYLMEILSRYASPPYDHLAVSFVFNGDIFDFLRTPAEPGVYDNQIDLSVAVRKLARIADAHDDFFEGMATLLADPRHEAHFIVGNHDPEVLFIGVQQDITRRLRAKGQVHFHPWAYVVGDVRIEHGSQGDSMFRMEPTEPFLKARGRDVIALPWGSVALLDVAMPMQPEIYHVDRVKPRDQVLAQLPELRELMVNAYWRYYTQDYFRQSFVAGDPMKRVTWTMLKEIISRFASGNLSLSVASRYAAWLERPDAPKLWIIGHEHTPAVHTFADRRLLVSGKWRNEFALSPDGKTQTHLPITYVEVFLCGDDLVNAGLVDIAPPPLPPGYCPERLEDVLPAVRRLLAPAEERAADTEARHAQEAKEAKAKDG